MSFEMEDRNNDTFEYTYSAQRQEEIENIKKKYLPREDTEDKMEQLRHLDRSTAKKGTVISIIMGVAGCLILGVGMCCTMVWSGLFVPGVAVGLAGIAAMAAALPLYNRVTRRERQKLAPLVRELTRDPGSPQAGC